MLLLLLLLLLLLHRTSLMMVASKTRPSGSKIVGTPWLTVPVAQRLNTKIGNKFRGMLSNSLE